MVDVLGCVCILLTDGIYFGYFHWMVTILLAREMCLFVMVYVPIKWRSHCLSVSQFKILHNACHFNLSLCFQNWPLQLTLKITWSLVKIKVAIFK